ncbi:MAG: diguanylate cyclase [Nitrospirae bacterium]|nr:diguanylate cyclase [Nitrospirota bacterium]
MQTKVSAEKVTHLPESLLPPWKEIRTILQVEFEDLAPLSAVVTKLLQLSGDEKNSLDQISSIIETDPSMAAKLLRVVNSPAYGLSLPKGNVKQAVFHIGFHMVMTLALESMFFDYFRNSAENMNNLFFWRHCLAVAQLSRHLAVSVGHPSPDDVYTAGLLHDIGKTILDRYGKISYGDFIKARCGSAGLLIEEEADIIGLGHDEVGAYFCCKWNLPPSITLAVKFHHQPFAYLGLSHDDALLIACVSMADFMAWTQGMGSVDIARQPLLQKEVDELINPSRIDLNSLVLKADREVKRVADFYGFTFPTSEALRENLIRANLHLGKIITGYYDHQKELEGDKGPLVNIGKSLAFTHKSLDFREIISSTLDAIKLDFAFDRVYFMEITDPTRFLAVKHVSCQGDTCGSLTNLQVNITVRMKGFMECLRTRKPVIIDGRSEDEQNLLNTLSLTEMGIVPIISDKRISGIVGIDNVRSRRPLQLDELSALVSVAQELGTALEHAKIVENYRVKANTDHLTGLYNRAEVDELLEKAFAAAKNGKTQLSVGMIDIDHFKKFNDTFGHLAGDGVLRLVAATLKKGSRPEDHTGRYGGEEFIVILTDTGYEDALNYAERLRGEIEKLGLTLMKRFKGNPLTVSIGIASINSSMSSRQVLLNKADKALYQAKELGRNRVVGGESILKN